MDTGFRTLRTWVHLVSLASFVGAAGCLLVGWWYLGENYTTRGWGLIGLGIGAAAFGVANRVVLSRAAPAIDITDDAGTRQEPATAPGEANTPTSP